MPGYRSDARLGTLVLVVGVTIRGTLAFPRPDRTAVCYITITYVPFTVLEDLFFLQSQKRLRHRVFQCKLISELENPKAIGTPTKEVTPKQPRRKSKCKAC